MYQDRSSNITFLIESEIELEMFKVIWDIYCLIGALNSSKRLRK